MRFDQAKKRDPLIQVAFLQVVPELTIDVVADFDCEFFRFPKRAGVVRLRANAPHQTSLGRRQAF